MSELLIKKIAADFSDTEGLIKQIKRTLRAFGVFMYDNPKGELTNCYSFVFTNQSMLKKDLCKAVK